MPPIVVAGAIAGAGALAGGIVSSAGQAQANKENAEQASNQMDFQERMSNTSYQRGVVDMRAAGINPILAADRGGASTPTGAMATMGNEGAGLGAGISSAVPTTMSAIQTQANVHLANAQAVQSTTQSALNKAQAEKALADAGYSNATAREAKVDADIAEANRGRRTSGWGRFVEGTGDAFGALGNIISGGVHKKF